jgi:hypothetical protein
MWVLTVTMFLIMESEQVIVTSDIAYLIYCSYFESLPTYFEDSVTYS